MASVQTKPSTQARESKVGQAKQESSKMGMLLEIRGVPAHRHQEYDKNVFRFQPRNSSVR